jgi:hypothetical protein
MDIAATVEKVVSTTVTTMFSHPANTSRLKAAELILRTLSIHRKHLFTAYETGRAFDRKVISDCEPFYGEWMQSLAPLAFEVARETKELVSIVDDVVSRKEVQAGPMVSPGERLPVSPRADYMQPNDTVERLPSNAGVDAESMHRWGGVRALPVPPRRSLDTKRTAENESQQYISPKNTLTGAHKRSISTSNISEPEFAYSTSRASVVDLPLPRSDRSYTQDIRQSVDNKLIVRDTPDGYHALSTPSHKFSSGPSETIAGRFITVDNLLETTNRFQELLENCSQLISTISQIPPRIHRGSTDMIGIFQLLLERVSQHARNKSFANQPALQRAGNEILAARLLFAQLETLLRNRGSKRPGNRIRRLIDRSTWSVEETDQAQRLIVEINGKHSALEDIINGIALPPPPIAPRFPGNIEDSFQNPRRPPAVPSRTSTIQKMSNSASFGQAMSHSDSESDKESKENAI